MEKKTIAEFFDKCAPWWDADMVRHEDIISTILTCGGVRLGVDVLDVACGTGVMFDYYLERGVASVTGIDISPEMAKIAARKYAGEPKVQVICGDVEEYAFHRKFDRIVVYNAFPHFPKPKRLIKILSGLLKENGRLTIAHGMSREAIDGHHSGAASKVSNGLMTAESLKRIFDAHFDVEVVISNRHMYQVSGVKRDPLAHSHDSDVAHTHGGLTHSHAHGDLDHEHHLDENATPLEELLVMMKYLVRHNDAHAQEVADLARNLQGAGRIDVYDEIMDAVKGIMLSAKNSADLNKILRLADYVKFAKHIPTPEENEEAYYAAYYFVEETKQVAEQVAGEPKEMVVDITPAAVEDKKSE